MFAHENKTTQTSSGALTANALGGRVFFQPKLTVNEPGDKYEQEADSMADKVMRMQVPASQSFFNPAGQLHRKCKDCEEDAKMLHRKEESTGKAPQVNGGLDNYVASLGSSGQPLPDVSRQFFEPLFGHDFSNVRIHTDSVAAKSAQSINALAYTTGNNIVFNQGQYAPNSASGQKLMAHELTHVVQQGNVIQPYRPTGSPHYGVGDTAVLTESSFNMFRDRNTKPWIENINVKMPGRRNFYEFGKATAIYHNNEAKLPDLEFNVVGGYPDDDHRKSTVGGPFVVYEIEGKGFNSDKYSGTPQPGERDPNNYLYSKNNNGNMNYAVFYYNGEALHEGPMDSGSHGCIHVDFDTYMQQINYHSVKNATKVNVSDGA